MSKERELLKKWLIECMWRGSNMSLLEETKELLAQPEQEPVAWIIETQKIDGTFDKWVSMNKKHHRDSCDRGEPIPLYASPQKQEPLSNEHLEDLVDYYSGYPMALGRAIEMAHDITGADDE